MSLTRLSLLCQIRDPTNSDSWAEFVSIYTPVITNTARRFGVPPEDIDDIRQDVFIQMMRTIQKFSKDENKGRFRSYLSQITANKIKDRWRKKTRQSSNIEDPSQIPDEPDTDSVFDEELHRELMQVALKKVKLHSNKTTWNCFQEHVLLKKTASVVASNLGISENAVFINCSRTTARIRKTAQTLKKEADRVLPVLSE